MDENVPPVDAVVKTEKEAEKQLNNTEKPWLWKEGQSGNPKGRPPKGWSLTETIKSMIEAEPALKKQLGAKIIDMAKQGDIAAIKLLWNYVDGMPKGTVQETNTQVNVFNEVRKRYSDDAVSTIHSGELSDSEQE